jgi:hypothetical protein
MPQINLFCEPGGFGGGIVVDIPTTGGVELWVKRNPGPLLPYQVQVKHPHAKPGAPPQPLHVDGRYIRTADQRVWVMKGYTHFPLLLKALLGADVDALISQFDDVLPAVEISHRILSLMGDLPARLGVPALLPENYPGYWSALPDLADRLNDKGHRLYVCVFADMQMFGWSRAQQEDHLGRVQQVLAGRDNIIGELVNQGAKNGIDPLSWPKPGNGWLWNRDSCMEGANPPMPTWGVTGTTGDRRRPNYWFEGSDLYYIRKGWDNPSWLGNGNVAAWMAEPIGCDEVDNGGSRIADPEFGEALGASAAAFGSGAVAHTQAGALGELCGPIQKAFCARMWTAAMAVEAVTP